MLRYYNASDCVLGLIRSYRPIKLGNLVKRYDWLKVSYEVVITTVDTVLSVIAY